MDIQHKLAALLTAHPELGLVWAGVLAAVFVALVAMSVTLRRRWNAGTMTFQVRPLKVPDSDVLLLLCGLCWLMVIPVGTWFFPAATICGVIWLLRRHGVDLRVQWGSGKLGVVKILGIALWVYLVVLGLLAPISWGMDKLAARFHWDTTPQFAVELLLQSGSPWRVGWLLFLAIVLAPASEEILFRGFLYPLLKNRMPAVVAWLLTAAIFAAIHFHAMTFPQLFLLGLVLVAAYEITGSLALCVGIHMCFNLVSASLLLAIKYATA